MDFFHVPGDSKWPFDPLVGGHLTFPKGHLTIPKRSPAELPGEEVLLELNVFFIGGKKTPNTLDLKSRTNGYLPFFTKTWAFWFKDQKLSSRFSPAIILKKKDNKYEILAA